MLLLLLFSIASLSAAEVAEVSQAVKAGEVLAEKVGEVLHGEETGEKGGHRTEEIVTLQVILLAGESEAKSARETERSTFRHFHNIFVQNNADPDTFKRFSKLTSPDLT